MTISQTTIPVLLSLPEVAKMFRVSNVSIYRLVESRKLPFYRVGRSLRFSYGDVMNYLAENRVGSIEESIQRQKNNV